MDKEPLSPETPVELEADEAAILAAWKAEKQPTSGADGAEDDSDENAAGAENEDAAAGEQEPEAENEGESEESQEEEQTEEEPEAEADDKPKPTGVQKRIDQLTAKSKTLEAENATLKEALQNASGIKPNQPIALVPLPDDPLSYLVTEAAVEEALSQAQGFLAWAKDNRNGATVQTANGPVEMSADDVEEFRAEQEAVLLAAPKRKGWITEYTKAHTEALQSYPDLFTKGTPQNAFVAEIIKAVPGLARNPRHEQIIGDLWMGQQLREGKMKAVKADPAQPKAKAAGPVPPAKKASLSSSASTPAPARSGGKPDTTDISRKAFSGEMDPDEAVAAMLAARG